MGASIVRKQKRKDSQVQHRKGKKRQLTAPKDSDSDLDDLNAPMDAGAAYRALIGSLSSSLQQSLQQQPKQAGLADRHQLKASQKVKTQQSTSKQAATTAAPASSPAVDGAAEQPAEQPPNHGTLLNGAELASTEPDTAAPADPEEPGVDTTQRHLEWELSADHIARLSSTGGAAALSAAEGQPGSSKDGAWLTTGGEPLPEGRPSLVSYGVKERLVTRWREVRQEDAVREHSDAAETSKGGHRVGDFGGQLQQTLFGLMNSYRDVLYPCRPYPTSPDQPDPLMDACLLHCLSHCASAAALIKRNNEALKRLRGGVGGDVVGTVEDPQDTPRDQGFTRPKVLILLPFRNAALRVVRRLLQLAQKETRADSIQNKERFLEDFGDDEEEELDTKAAKQKQKEKEKAAKEPRRSAVKPPEHTALFSGNCDDHFRLGIKITRGAVRLYSEFLQSDIVVASPIALTTLLEEGGAGAADFLSSIEICLVERADVLQMQNWAHVLGVFEALNRVPQEQHGADIMRVRHWHLNGHARLYRQTILLSSFLSPELNSLFSRSCTSHAGRGTFKPWHTGILSRVFPQVRQQFERFSAESAAQEPDARFEFFRRQVWPRIRENAADGQLLFVPSYYDFLRLQRFLQEQDASFAALSEYSAGAAEKRARGQFFHRRRRILLYTERAHFYHRFRTRGALDVHFYQLPEHPQFYPELVNLLEEASSSELGMQPGNGTVSVVFSRFDALRLERIVGSERAKTMLKASSSTVVFV